MRTPLDLQKMRFGRLLVIGRYPISANNKKIRWVCICDCGNQSVVTGTDLKSGHTMSCGCVRREALLKANSTHGHAKRMAPSREYVAYHGMLKRCLNTKDKSYKYYGGRGISVCDQWLHSFENFLNDMGKCPNGCTIERMNNQGNYEPSNCRWATHEEQMRNTRHNRWIEWEGQKRTLSEWSQILGVTRASLAERLSRLPIEIALTMPRSASHARSRI